MFAMFNNQLFWYNSCVKLIISLLLVCAPFAWLAVETFVLAPSLEPDAEAVTNVPVVVNMERLKTCAASISFEASGWDAIPMQTGTSISTRLTWSSAATAATGIAPTFGRARRMPRVPTR